jgi:hypothetical protein
MEEIFSEWRKRGNADAKTEELNIVSETLVELS